MARHPLTVKYVKAIKDALKQFGEYHYYDKGAHEVMEVDFESLLALPQAERVLVIKELMAHKHGQQLCIALESDIQDLPDAEADELLAIIER